MKLLWQTEGRLHPLVVVHPPSHISSLYVLFFNSHGVSISNIKHQDIHFVIISDELVSFLNVLDRFLRTIIIYNFALKQKDASIKMLVLAIP